MTETNEKNWLTTAELANLLNIKVRRARALAIQLIETDPALAIRSLKTGNYLIASTALPVLKNRKTRPGPKKGTQNKIRLAKTLTRRERIRMEKEAQPDISPYQIAHRLNVAVTTVYRDLIALGLHRPGQD